MKLYLVLAVSFVSTASVLAQSFHKRLGLSGGAENAIGMVVLPSGNIIGMGWSYVDSAIVVTKVNGANGDVFFFKELSRTSGPVGYIYAAGFQLTYTSSDQILAVGYLQGPGSQYQPHPPMVMLVDTNGNVLMARGVGTSYWDEVPGLGVEVAPGSYAVTMHDGGPQDYYSGTCVMLLDGTGSVTNGRCYKQGENFSVGMLVALPDHSLVLAGGQRWPFNSPFDSEGILLKVDEDLDPVWAKTYIGYDVHGISRIVMTNDGGFLTLSWADDTATTMFDILLMKTSGTGDLVWAKRYSNPGNRLFISDLSASPDGTILVAAAYQHEASSNYDGFIMKTDSNGSLLWAHNYGDSVSASTNNDRVISATAGQDGIVFFGHTTAAGTSDFMVGKTDANGFASCYQNAPDITVEDVSSAIRDSSINVFDSVATKTFYNWGLNSSDITVQSEDLCIVGIDRLDQPQIEIHPNPASDFVTITRVQEPGRLSIIHVNGQVVHENLIASQVAVVPVGTYPPGIYVVRVETGQLTQLSKLIVH
jgi:hypothetical protein